MIDREGLAQFLRRRREVLQPEDVGLPRGQRRRTAGLRREEVAALCHMSTDYYARLETRRGPQPSEQMVASIAQGLHLTRAERDHLFHLAGHHPPASGPAGEHVGPGILRILDRLGDTPAEIVTELGETLRQTPLSVALVGDLNRRTGPGRSIGYRWFTEPETRALYRPQDHELYSRLYASALRRVVALRGPGSTAAHLRDRLLSISPDFADYWQRHEVGVQPPSIKHYRHPELGALELQCQTLIDPEHSHALLVYTAVPGTESHEKLPLLGALVGRS